MTTKKLVLPPTIRMLTEDELPANPSLLARLKEGQQANIVPGYTFTPKTKNENQQELPFSFYAEINVDNTQLWELFIALAATLPQQASLLFGPIDADIHYGNYTDTASILQTLEPYKTELTQDPFLVFALLYHDKEQLIEIYVDESKYIKYWGVDESAFRSLLAKYQLTEQEDLNFIDEYPKIRNNLKLANPSVLDTAELIQLLLVTFT
ncbi:hypothetical protein [Myroides sp. DW712]|uniref:hypothetical protein n=1 Tax=Myroides sp. DW712 TaxID=3389800 RepID=UPI00397C80DE